MPRVSILVHNPESQTSHERRTENRQESRPRLFGWPRYSIILKWLQETYGAEVVTFTADLGQGEELEPARKKALMLGIKEENIFVEDLREEFVRDFVFPMFRANTVYEGIYLLGTSIARPADRKEADRDRTQGRGRCRLPRRHRQGQRSGPL